MKRLNLSVAFTLILGIICFRPATVLAASYRIVSPGDSISVSCESRNGCQYSGVVLFNNDSGKDLYNTTLWTGSSQYSGIEFVGFDGSWTSGQSQANHTIAPDNGPSVQVKMTFPSNLPIDITQWTSTLYIDGKTCNLNTNPPDCYFYGGKSFQITLTVNQPSATATPTQTVLTTTSTPIPTVNPTATPTQTTQPQTPTNTPTVSPAKPTPTIVAKSNTVANNTPTPTAVNKSETNENSPTANGNTETVSESQEVKVENKIAKIISQITKKDNPPKKIDQVGGTIFEATSSPKVNPVQSETNLLQKSINLLQKIIKQLFSSLPKKVLA